MQTLISRAILCVCVCVRYGLRYTAKVLRDSLHEKFPQASEEELYKVSVFISTSSRRSDQ